ncbi:MAG: trimeric intracellular cation channel family protein [Actinomycetota bacterium]
MFELPLPLSIALVVGTIAFAASGAVAGVRAGMDWLGVSTLAAVTAIGGGTLRDLLMVTTPFWLIDFWPTVGIIGATVLVVWVLALLAPWQTNPGWMRHVFTVTDAVGLAAFTVVGTDVARSAGFGVGPALILGVLSGIGGGVIRDLIAGRRISVFFTGEVYALAAALGSAAFLATSGLGAWTPFVVGIAVTLVVRLGAMALGWRVPTLPTSEP